MRSSRQPSSLSFILSYKIRHYRFKTAIFSWWFEHRFTFKSIRERLKRDFDDPKSFLFSFNASYRYIILACCFAHVDSLSAENMIPVLLSSAILI